MNRNHTRRALLCAALGAALLAGTGLQHAAAQRKTLVIKGSDTMVNLSQAWAEAYMKARPGAQVSVTGGGTGTGIAAFLNGTADIANASREMSQSEIQRSKDKGIIPRGTICALDGLAVAVHSSNPVQSLTMQQLAQLFGGGASDWSQVGGRGGRIIALSRETSSGTYVYFREKVLGGRNYRPDVLLMPSTKAIASEISRNPNAIGYGGEAYFRGQNNVKIIPIAPRTGAQPVMPTDEAVRNKSYPIARPLYMYTPGAPTGTAADFIKFCLSPAGQEVVKQVGYTPIK
jgi:phosphate transport system substrate-binding protein